MLKLPNVASELLILEASVVHAFEWGVKKV